MEEVCGHGKWLSTQQAACGLLEVEEDGMSSL